MSTATVQIDDRDLGISYFGQWTLVGTNNPKVFEGTFSETAHANAGLQYTFTGVQISIYGVGGYSGPPPIVEYSLDDNLVETLAAPNVTSEVDNLLMYQSPILALGSHHLIANVSQASTAAQWSVDYIIVLPTSTTTPISSPSNVLPPSPSSSQGGSVSGAVINESSHKHDVGAIVGGVVGGVAILVLLILGLLLLKQRSSGRRLYAGSVTEETEEAFVPETRDLGAAGQVTPYLLPRDHSSTTSFNPPPSKSARSPTSSRSPYSFSSSPQPMSSPTEYSHAGPSHYAPMNLDVRTSQMSPAALETDSLPEQPPTHSASGPNSIAGDIPAGLPEEDGLSDLGEPPAYSTTVMHA